MFWEREEAYQCSVEEKWLTAEFEQKTCYRNCMFRFDCNVHVDCDCNVDVYVKKMFM